MKLLLIDDDEIILEFLKLSLEENLPDAEVVEYQSEELGKPKPDFDWSPYDALLLDYNLGHGETGVAWLKEFGGRSGFPPTILITAVNDPYVVGEAIQSGAQGYLNKANLTPESLVAAVKDLLGPTLDETMPPPEPAKAPDAEQLVEQFEREEASRVGKDHGSYRFTRCIGGGAMSRVYLAERAGDKATVVLKILDRKLATDPTWIKRFVQEGEIVSGLDTTYVVKVYEQDFTNNYAYIAMEFFGRGDLQQRLKHGISTNEAVEFMYHICRGLQAIHEKGIVHRDLKPANIMFRADGSMALVDFGVSKVMNTDLDLTSTGSIFGTPYYMSPDEANSLAADERSDIYSAGCIFFEMLTGERPYVGKTVTAVLFQHMHAPLPQLPEELARFQPVIDRLMAKEKEDRFQTAAEVCESLASLAAVST